jgi:hypothetical protein
MFALAAETAAESSSLFIVFQGIAIGATTLFVLKLIALFLGADSGDADPSLDIDDATLHHTDSDSDFKLFSLQAILAFLMGFGWMGWQLFGSGQSATISIIGAFVVGVAMMVFTAWLMSLLTRFNKESGLDVGKAIGLIGRVYLTVPEKRSGQGKVEVIIGETKVIMSAVTDGEKIDSFKEVKIIGLENGELLIVETATPAA